MIQWIFLLILIVFFLFSWNLIDGFKIGAQENNYEEELDDLSLSCYWRIGTDNNLEYRFYLLISLLVILFFFIKDISLTFFDRVNYYFIPLQLLVYANINKLNLMSNIKTSFKLIVITGYVFILFYSFYCRQKLFPF